jgi:hypothetical protein
MRGATGVIAPGSVGAIAFMCRPHCWQYAKPTGVGVPQRGHAIVDGVEDGRGDASGPRGMPPPPVPAPITGGGVANGPAGGIIGAPIPGAKGSAPPTRAAPPEGGAECRSNAGEPGVVACNAPPQLRQNFIPAGFSPRHEGQITGNPAACAGVCVGGGASALPQLRQNDDPGGLWWPQDEQRSID